MALIPKTKPSQSTRKLDQQKPSPEIVAESDEVFYGELASRDGLGCADDDHDDDDDGDFITILDKFKVERWVYETIESSFDAMYSNLMADVEYGPEELVGGYVLDEYYDRLDGRMKTFLCLKHMAMLPNARISVLDWNTFALV
jgi:hypothetical protein